MNTARVALAIARAGDEALEEPDSSLPEQLFHYTDTAGLIGILANKGQLWATDVRCMNDTDELTLGESLLEEALSTKSEHPAHPLLIRLMAHPAYVSGIVFTISFSACSDLLSQWRAYADNGAGFAVGFRSAELERLTLNDKVIPSHLVKVEYQPDIQRIRAKRVVQRILSALEPLVEQALDDRDDQFVATSLGLVFRGLSATAKNAGFYEEAEYRVVLRSNQDPILAEGTKPQLTMPVCDFRAGRYGITPFLKLRPPEGSLSDGLSNIVIGPRGNADAEQKARVLLANAGVRNWSSFSIRRSAATYR